MPYTFDGATKIISIVGQTVMSVRDVYSRWADWYAANAQWLPAFRFIGGDAIDPDAGTFAPVFAYLINGWRIRPQESSHTLNVTDGVLLVEGGGDPFLDTIGAFVVRINKLEPVAAITVATGGGGGLTAAQDQRLERIEKLLRNKQITDPAAGELRVYEDDGSTVLMRGDVFEDAAGSQRYRGNGAERRERLT